MTTVTYQLFLEEPLLMTAPGGDPNADNSYAYVPGSALRGALVNRYLQQGGSADDDRFARLFLNGQVCFLNAYPVGGDGRRALPTPESWVLAKDSGQKTIFDRAQGEEPALPTGIGTTFVLLDGNEAVPLDNMFQVSIHTSRNREMGRAVEGDPGSAVYQYRALPSQTWFRGAVVVNSGDHASADAALLTDLLTDAYLMLGGSQTAGYGLTRVEAAAAEDTWRESGGETAAVAAGESLVLYLLSDAILRDPNTGRESNDILAALPTVLQDKIVAAPGPHAFTRMTWVGGFNTTWGLPLPQEWAVQKGSLWRLTAVEAISRDEIAALEAVGIGQRRAEGFGRVAVNPPWLTGNHTLAESETAGVITEDDATAAPAPTPEPAAVNAQVETLLAGMNQRLVAPELERRLVIAAQKKAERPRGRLSGSQLARLRLRLRRQQGDFKDFQQYLKGTYDRKSADDQFRKFRVGGENFRLWLEHLAEKPDQVWEQILPADAAWQPATIGEYTLPKEDAELTHRYAARFMDAVCEQLAKGMK